MQTNHNSKAVSRQSQLAQLTGAAKAAPAKVTPALQTLTIAAGATVPQQTTAAYITIKTATLPFNVSFGGGPAQSMQAGSALAISNGALLFTNPNTVAITIAFWLANNAVQFQPIDNSSANPATVAYGDLGVLPGEAAANGLPACDANGYLQITNGMQLLIGSTDPDPSNAGHRRQLLYLCVDPNAANTLQVQDAKGGVMLVLSKGAIVQLPTDAPLLLSGNGGTVGVVVGQIFLASN